MPGVVAPALSDQQLAEILHMIAKIYSRQDDFDQAMRYYQQALEVEQAKLGPLHPNIASELRISPTMRRE